MKTFAALILVTLSGCAPAVPSLLHIPGTAVNECKRLDVPEMRSNMEYASMRNGGLKPDHCYLDSRE